jgi:hypothetical protein
MSRGVQEGPAHTPQTGKRCSQGIVEISHSFIYPI